MTTELERMKARYPAGTRIKLIHMDDAHAVPEGTEGTVRNVDDIGTIHVDWDNGSSLGLIAGVDSFVIIKDGDKEA